MSTEDQDGNQARDAEQGQEEQQSRTKAKSTRTKAKSKGKQKQAATEKGDSFGSYLKNLGLYFSLVASTAVALTNHIPDWVTTSSTLKQTMAVGLVLGSWLGYTRTQFNWKG